MFPAWLVSEKGFDNGLGLAEALLGLEGVGAADELVVDDVAAEVTVTEEEEGEGEKAVHVEGRIEL
jgi:hypothetical protein